MADDEIMIEDDAIALEDTDDTVARRCTFLILFLSLWNGIRKLKTIVIKMKSVGFGRIGIIVVCTGQMYSLQSQRSLASLSK